MSRSTANSCKSEQKHCKSEQKHWFPLTSFACLWFCLVRSTELDSANAHCFYKLITDLAKLVPTDVQSIGAIGGVSFSAKSKSVLQIIKKPPKPASAKTADITPDWRLKKLFEVKRIFWLKKLFDFHCFRYVSSISKEIQWLPFNSFDFLWFQMISQDFWNFC